MHPLITIGITCYNAQDTIVRALESAVAQTYAPKEILVVDDASTDNSAGVIADFIKNHPDADIRYLRHEQNAGFPTALNTLVTNAGGEYIAFFDDDDASVPDRLEKQLSRIEAYAGKTGRDKILCYSNRLIYKVGQDAPDHVTKAIGRTPPEPHGPIVADHILWRAYGPFYTWGLFGSCTLMTRTQFLKDLGLFDTAFRRSAELDMAVRAALAGAHFIAVDEPLISQYKTATTDKAGKIPLTYTLRLRHKHKDYLKAKGVYWAALCLTHYQYYIYKNKAGPKKYLWLSAACLSAPRKLLLAGLAQALNKTK